MSDRYAERDHQSWERMEIESMRRPGRTISVDDLEGVERVGEKIADAAQMLLHMECIEAGVRRVYICGSFARGEAIPMISDLDARVLIDRAIEPFTEERIAEELRTEVGSEIVPDQAGFLDARLSNVVPDDCPAVCVWESKMYAQ